jgi:hypothetical protein
MIRLENTEVQGWEAAIRGMRNPMNSGEKSDSCWMPFDDPDFCNHAYLIGPADLTLMKKLAKAGSDHRKFMRFITVTVDITAPLYWWKEFDTYKVGTVANSCSTMHKIHAKEFTLDDFSHEHLEMLACDTMEYHVIKILNIYRKLFLEKNDKKYWWQMIQLLPTSYNQRRTVLLNYEVLRNMYHARKAHKLDEWRVGFCSWVKSLPYAELITGGADDDGTGEGQA